MMVVVVKARDRNKGRLGRRARRASVRLIQADLGMGVATSVSK